MTAKCTPSGVDGGKAEKLQKSLECLFGRARVFAKELNDAKLLSEEGWKRTGGTNSPKGIKH